MKLTRGHAHRSLGNPQLLMTAVRTRRTIRNRWAGGGGGVFPAPYMNKKVCYLYFNQKHLHCTILVTFVETLSRYALPNVNSCITDPVVNICKSQHWGRRAKIHFRKSSKSWLRRQDMKIPTFSRVFQQNLTSIVDLLL